MSSIKNRLTTLYLVLFAIAPFVHAWGQDAQQQKVIDAIQGELQSFIKKDKLAWTNYWIHSKDVTASFASPGFLDITIGWDSLLNSVEEHFATPGETFKATKAGSYSAVATAILGAKSASTNTIAFTVQ